MASQHPYYNYLVVYYGEQGEKAHAGAFYVPKYGDTLSKVANAAYGFLSSTLQGVQRINRSLWNIQAAEANAFNYRRNSTSCKSKVVDPRLSLTTVGYNDGAWLALCPPYPLFWVPSKDGEMPEHLAPTPGPIKKGAFTAAPPPPSGGQKIVAAPPKPSTGTFSPAGPGPSSPYTQEPAKSVAKPIQPAAAQAGFSKWLLLALLLAGGGAYLWYRSKKKKKRKK